MTVTTANKTEGTTVLALQSVSASSVAIGGSQAVTTKFASVFNLFFARTATSAPAAGVTFRIEGLAVSGGSAGQWVPLASYTTGIIAAVTSAISSTSGAALTVASGGASFTAGLSAYVHDGTLANSEWFWVLSGASTVITAQENFINNHTTGNAYTQAERASINVDLSAVSHVRVVADGSLHNQTFDCMATMSTFDSVTTA